VREKGKCRRPDPLKGLKRKEDLRGNTNQIWIKRDIGRRGVVKRNVMADKAEEKTVISPLPETIRVRTGKKKRGQKEADRKSKRDVGVHGETKKRTIVLCGKIRVRLSGKRLQQVGKGVWKRNSTFLAMVHKNINWEKKKETKEEKRTSFPP